MTETSYPQEGILIGDAINAPYSAEEFSLHILANLTGFGRRADNGPIKGYDNGVNYGLEVTQTTPASSNITVWTGAAIVQGTVYENDASEVLAIGANASGNPRIDTVVIRKDYVLQTIRAAIRQGTPAASPVPPTLTQTDGVTWEIPLADIRVSNGFSTIVDNNIIPRHQWVNTGDALYIDGVLNATGATLEDGDVVIWNTTFRTATTTTTVNHSRIAGVWDSRSTPNGETGRIMVRGYKRVRLKIANASGVSASGSIGQMVVTGDTAKKATLVDSSLSSGGTLVPPLTGTDVQGTGPHTGHSPNQLGYLQEAISLANGASHDDYTWIRVDVQPSKNPLFFRVFNAQSGSSGGGTLTSGATNARPLNIIRSSMGYLASTTTDSGANPYVSLSGGNTLVLQPGRYFIRGSAPAYRVNSHVVLFVDTTHSLTIATGTSEYSPSAADSTASRSWFSCIVAPKVQTNYQLQHTVQTTRATDGGGVSSNGIGITQVYADLEIIRLGDIT